MRKLIVLVVAMAAAAATPATAQTWLESRMMASVCNSKAAPADESDRLSKRLALTDPQKAALKDLSDASAAAAASMKTALCGDKPDLATATGRMAFSEKMTSARLDTIKAIDPSSTPSTQPSTTSRRRRSTPAARSAASSTGSAGCRSKAVVRQSQPGFTPFQSVTAPIATRSRRAGRSPAAALGSAGGRVGGRPRDGHEAVVAVHLANDLHDAPIALNFGRLGRVHLPMAGSSPRSAARPAAPDIARRGLRLARMSRTTFRIRLSVTPSRLAISSIERPRVSRSTIRRSRADLLQPAGAPRFGRTVALRRGRRDDRFGVGHGRQFLLRGNTRNDLIRTTCEQFIAIRSDLQSYSSPTHARTPVSVLAPSVC